MKKRFELYRQFEGARLVIFRGKENAITQVETFTEGTNEEIDPIRSGDTLSEKLGEMEMKYGEAAYREVIQKMADKLIPPDLNKTESKPMKDGLVQDSVERYMKHYLVTRNEFIQQSGDLKEAFNQAEKEIQGRTQDELMKLKASLETAHNFIDLTNENLPKFSEKNEVNKHFGSYLETLNNHYFNPKITDGREWNYNMKSREFKGKMDYWVQSRLNVIEETKGGESQFISLKQEIKARYARYANFDGDATTISSIDLRVLDGRMQPADDKMGEFLDQADADPHSEKYRQFVARLEDNKLMHPEVWKAQVDSFGINIVKQVQNDRAEQGFIQEVTTKIEPVKNFKQAKNVFLRHMNKLSDHNVQEVLNFVDTFNIKVFESTLIAETSIENEYPGTFGPQIRQQVDHLMSGITVPERDNDRLIVRFMRGGKKEREEILSHHALREQLLKAITEATSEKGYAAVFKKKFGDITKKTTHSQIISAPSHHDNAARLKALMVLGAQAKVIVGNYNNELTHEFQNRENDVDTKVLTNSVSVKFKVPMDSNNIHYRSKLEQGGFNTRDLGLKALKIFGAISVLMNFSQEWTSGNKSDKFLVRLGKSAKSALSNPGFMVAAGGMILAHKAEQDPRYLKWPWLSEYEKQDVSVADKLRDMGNRAGAENRDRLLNNPVEWKLAQKLKRDPEKFKALMDKADKAKVSGKKISINQKDLEEAGVLDKTKDADIYYNLSSGSNRSRYLLYHHFLRDPNTNVNDVKEHCTGSSFIAES